MWRLFGTREAILGAAILAACLLFAFLSPTFATPANIATILRNSTELFLVGLGMTLLLGVGARGRNVALPAAKVGCERRVELVPVRQARVARAGLVQAETGD